MRPKLQSLVSSRSSRKSHSGFDYCIFSPFSSRRTTPKFSRSLAILFLLWSTENSINFFVFRRKQNSKFKFSFQLCLADFYFSRSCFMKLRKIVIFLAQRMILETSEIVNVQICLTIFHQNQVWNCNRKYVQNSFDLIKNLWK